MEGVYDIAIISMGIYELYQMARTWKEATPTVKMVEDVIEKVRTWIENVKENLCYERLLKQVEEKLVVVRHTMERIQAWREEIRAEVEHEIRRRTQQ